MFDDVSRDSKSIWALVVIVFSSALACRNKANAGAPEQVSVRIDRFDGQDFVGRLTLQNARGGEVSADGTLTLTLLAGHELCSGSLDVHKSQFVTDKDNPVYTTLPIALSASERCPAPDPGGPPMSMRVVFETSDGARIERGQKAMAAADWAADLRARYDEALVRARIPHETQRLASVVDIVAPNKAAPRAACPREVRRGDVTRVVQDHLLQIAGRASGADQEPSYGWASDPQYQWLAGWSTKRLTLDEKMVALALGAPKRYLEIVRVDAFTAPATTERSRVVNGGKARPPRIADFKPGSIAATVSIVDVANRTVACRGTITARSSRDVAPSPGDPLALDLRRNFEKAVADLEIAIAKAPLR